MVWQLNEMRLSMLQVSTLAKINYSTTRKVFDGRANNNKVWRVAKVLKLDWAQLHNLDLQESDFHLATKDGARSKSAG